MSVALDIVLGFVPVYVLVLFRIAGMMIWAPLLGSTQIPRRIKAMMACVLAASIAPTLTSVHIVLPGTYWELAVDIGGEIIFGAAMGLILSMIFVSAQWAGEMIGQQMGLNIGQTLNPQFGGGGSVMGDIYFYLTLLIFLSMGGHMALIKGVFDSFQALPLLSVGMHRTLLATLAGLFQGATILAMQLAAPMLVTMLIVDLILGFVGKTVPQLNIMTAGISIRSLVGLMVAIFGLSIASNIVRAQLNTALLTMYRNYVVQ